MSTIRFCTACDRCGTRAAEYRAWPICEVCGDLCRDCAEVSGHSFRAGEGDGSDEWLHAIDAGDARAGDLVDPRTLPETIVREGGGWQKYLVTGVGWSTKYFCRGAHRDGRSGWVCTEVR